MEAMQIKLYNGLSKSKEIFTPAKNIITLYVCGPTIYDYIHVGNARSLVVFDLLYRTLKLVYGRNSVNYVRNITDVDDKINERARSLGISIKALTEKTLKDFHEDANYINCLPPTYEPKALDHIEEMIEIIASLVEKKIAYISEDHVYFDVSQYSEYYKLSNQNAEENLAGVRINVEESKRHPNDFVLWKPANPSDDILSVFDSPWGKGRPGWHIECSAMSHKYLGENFDIHGGGVDLIFPHHTNEIAQSRCAFPNSHHARYWVHNGFLTIEGQKMSKSLGNFITVNDIKRQNIHGEVLRLALMNTHYRRPLDYSKKSLSDSQENLNYFYRSIEFLEDLPNIENSDLPGEFIDSILDDLNTNEAFAIMHQICKSLNKEIDPKKKNILARKLIACGNFLGILREDSKKWSETQNISEEIKSLIEERKLYKEQKNWEEADRIRNSLLKLGIIIEDKNDGTYLIRKKT